MNFAFSIRFLARFSSPNVFPRFKSLQQTNFKSPKNNKQIAHAPRSPRISANFFKNSGRETKPEKSEQKKFAHRAVLRLKIVSVWRFKVLQRALIRLGDQISDLSAACQKHSEFERPDQFAWLTQRKKIFFFAARDFFFSFCCWPCAARVFLSWVCLCVVKPDNLCP